MPTETAWKVTVADGTVAVVLGCVKGIPVSFGSAKVLLHFLVVFNTPVDVIVGIPALDVLQACLDFSRQKITLVVDAEEMCLPFHSQPSLFDGRLATNSEHFTCPGDSDERRSKDGSESSASSSADESDGAPELVLAIVNKDQYEPDLEWVDGDTTSFEWDEKCDRSVLLAMKMQHLLRSERAELTCRTSVGEP